MELARLERELRKPINWGARTYWNLKNRENHLEQLSGFESSVTTNENIRKALEEHPVITGPLDASDVLNQLSEDDLCSYFASYSKCQVLILQNWFSISMKVLRSISMTFGESLIELDLSNSYVNSQHLEIICVRTTSLHILRLNNCYNVDSRVFMVVVPLLFRQLQELYLRGCVQFSNECLNWIGGTGSLSGQSLSLLRVLDISDCLAVNDVGLATLAHGCRKLMFLNLENVSSITDKSFSVILKSCQKIQLLNLSGCSLLSNKSLSLIGKYCQSLISLNLSRCSLVTDKAVKSIALGCKDLQAINLAGCHRVSEESMFCLADSCKGLLTMNLTGCDRITTNGLENLVMGLEFVEKAHTFFGFKPIDGYLESLLEKKLKFILTKDTRDLEERIKREKLMKLEEAARQQQLIFRSACLIQQYLFRYKKRQYFFKLWQLRMKKSAVLLLQRVYRGYLGRRRAEHFRLEREEFYACKPYAIHLQCRIRGFLCRIHNPQVSKCIRELYIIRRREVESAMAVRIQAHARRFLAGKYVVHHKEVVERAKRSMNDAALILQMLARRFLSKMELFRRLTKKKNLEEARKTAGLKIKKFSVEGMRRYKSRLSGESLKRFFRHKWTASIVIQRYYRGFKSRERFNKLRIDKATKFYAAREIQRVFRGSRVLHYKDLRLNVIAAFVLDRHYVERRERVEAARLRYRQYILMNQQDSASEPDTDEDDQQPWTKQWDAKKKLPYWQNFATNEITYDEPLVPLAHEKGMIGKRIKVYWIVQGQWYEGTITRYHIRKKRHRVEYDDGDHEWMNLESEGDRIQVIQEDGTWILYLMYQSEEKLNEIRKIEQKAQRDEFKAKAFRDATQWKSFNDDYNQQIMFLSILTGEIRTGAPNALEWLVQDDGHGFPCFYNTVTHQVLYEDPRFKNDIDEDLLQQRKYVLQEMRYLLYICKNLWEEYTHILQLNDKRQLYKVMMKIRGSNQIQQLSSFIIRAKALFEPSSIVDKPIDKALLEEFEYASWMVARLSEVIDQAEKLLVERRDKKRNLIDKLTEKNDEVVYCRYCKRETQKHLAFCPTCGKQQLFY